METINEQHLAEVALQRDLRIKTHSRDNTIYYSPFRLNKNIYEKMLGRKIDSFLWKMFIDNFAGHIKDGNEVIQKAILKHINLKFLDYEKRFKEIREASENGAFDIQDKK